MMRNCPVHVILFSHKNKGPNKNKKLKTESMNRREIMKGMKKTIGIVFVLVLVAIGIYTFVAVKGETSSEHLQLRMAHGQSGGIRDW